MKLALAAALACLLALPSAARDVGFGDGFKEFVRPFDPTAFTLRPSEKKGRKGEFEFVCMNAKKERGLNRIPLEVMLKAKNGVCGDFKGARLAGRSLAGFELDGADFTGADLAGADFTNAKLQEAVFNGARLHGAKLGRSYLVHGYLKNASLREADLTRADISLSDFSGADVRGVSFKGATTLYGIAEPGVQPGEPDFNLLALFKGASYNERTVWFWDCLREEHLAQAGLVKR